MYVYSIIIYTYTYIHIYIPFLLGDAGTYPFYLYPFCFDTTFVFRVDEFRNAY